MLHLVKAHHVRNVIILFILGLLGWFYMQNGAEDTEADSVYLNAAIWTGNPDQPEAGAMAIADGRIIAVGDSEAMGALIGPNTRVRDMGGARITPGFIDSHTHFFWGGFGLASVKLRDADTPAEFARRIGEYAKTVPAGEWIMYGDWDHELWGGTLPQANWIDALTPEHPVFVTRLDGHMSLANSLAMELAGVDKNTPDVAGGEIVRDAEGNPTGVFKDNAAELISRVIPEPSKDAEDRAMDAAIAYALSLGVTQVHNMADFRQLEAFQRAHDDERLHIRAYSMVPIRKWEELRTYVADNGRGDDVHRWGGLKGFMDGSLGSTTAWFYEPFDDAPETNGFPLANLDELKADIMGADAAGLHVIVHAIGDQAIDWLLDTYDEARATNANADQRFRVEHAQHPSRKAIARFGADGVIPSMQPYHAIDDGRWAEKRIGPERIKTTYAFRSMLDAGAPLAFGSDWTVAPLNVMWGIYAAVTRRTFDGANPGGWVPEQKITVEEALTAYTAGSAYAGYQEDVLGTLEVGKYADFVVLSDDILHIDPIAIEDVTVKETVVNGVSRYRAD